jgi:hypothetical protein
MVTGLKDSVVQVGKLLNLPNYELVRIHQEETPLMNKTTTLVSAEEATIARIFKQDKQGEALLALDKPGRSRPHETVLRDGSRPIEAA